MNDQLSKGRYFFVDIINEGVTLLSRPGVQLAEPKPIAPETVLTEAEGYFGRWMASANGFLRSAKHDLADGDSKLAAFHFHQTAENLYQCLMLVMTLHTPKSHNLVRLRQLTEPFDARLADVWPTETKLQKRTFELLKQGYVNARYSEHYKVTAEELAFMRERIEVLGGLVVDICQAQLAALAEAAKA